MFSMGPLDDKSGGPASWSEVAAFGSSTGAITEDWEFVALRNLCRNYALGLKEGADPLSIPPVERSSDD